MSHTVTRTLGRTYKSATNSIRITHRSGYKDLNALVAIDRTGGQIYRRTPAAVS